MKKNLKKDCSSVVFNAFASLRKVLLVGALKDKNWEAKPANFPVKYVTRPNLNP